MAAGHRARCIVFCNQCVAVVNQIRPAVRAVHNTDEATQRTVVKLCRASSTGHEHQAVLNVVEVSLGPVRGQIAIGIVGDIGTADTRILVETVGGVGAVDVDMAIPAVAIVGLYL